MVDGQGQLAVCCLEHTYPPLWGKHRYIDSAGLFRISTFAKYVKYDMSMGTTHSNPMLLNEEAWDVAVFINSQSRPHLKTPNDWPDISKKPMDHPFGPYADTFSEKQYKFGSFLSILETQKNSSKAITK